MRTSTKYVIAFVCLIVPFTGLAVDVSSLKGLRVEPPKKIVPVAMTNHKGVKEQFPGSAKRWRLVFFGYTRCPDICPTTMFTVSQVVKKLGPDAQNLEVVFVSVDGLRDTTGDISRFVGYYGKDVLGLTGEPKAIAKLNRQFGITTRKFRGETALAYTLQHSIYLYLLDTNGRIRYMYTAADSPQMISRDLKTLLSQKSG